MSGFRVTFLGTGTSVGVPMVGCACPVCTSDNPRNRRLRASIYVETPDFRFVVDTGPDFRAQCLREGIVEVDAALYTHAHTDHVMGFDDLRRFCQGEATIPIFGTQECLEKIQLAFGFAFDKSNWHSVYVKPVQNVVDGPFSIANAEIRVTPLNVRHGKVRTVGYAFEREDRRLAYVPDCKIISDEAMDAMRDLDCLILDATSFRDIPTHLSVEQALAVVEKVQPRETWLTHMCHDVDHDVDEAKLPAGVKFAYDGLKLHV